MSVSLPDMLARFNAAQPWRAHAACRGMDTALFFDGGRAAEARRVCAGCPVAPECAESAIADGEDHGIWGGMTERARVRAGRQRRLAEGGWLAVCERCAAPFPSTRRRGNFPRYCDGCRPGVHAETVARARRRAALGAAG